MAVRAVVAAALVWGAGCASLRPEDPLPVEAVANLRAGHTTMSDARVLLGEPDEIETQPEGTTTWLYTFSYSPAASPSPDPPPPSEQIPRYDLLRLVFQPDGVLASHDVTHMVAQPRRAGVPGLKAIGSP